METLIGWVDTGSAIINLLTGLVVEPGEVEGTVDVTLPSGDVKTFEAEDANAVLQRAEQLAALGEDMSAVMAAKTAEIVAAQGAAS